MANPLRFFRRRRSQPKGRATPQSAFFSPVGGQQTSAGEPFFTAETAFVQPKLTINQSGDAHEQEADKMANHVVQRATMKPDKEKVQRRGKHDEDEHVQRKTGPEEEKPVQRKSEKEEEKPIQKKGGPGQSAALVSASQLHSTKGQGSPLPTPVQREMSQAFGHDFSPVRIHTSSRAEQLSQDLQALAFTHGKDVYFNAGQYNPQTTEGKQLLAHELTHVVQQNGTELTEVQRYAVPSSLPCNKVVEWMTDNSPYAPDWAATKCTYQYNGNLTIKTEPIQVKATVSGSPRLSVSVSCPIDAPSWRPTKRPNQAAEQAAWDKAKGQLMTHEKRHQKIGEEQRKSAEANFRTVNFEVTAADKNEAMQLIQARVQELQQKWNQDA